MCDSADYWVHSPHCMPASIILPHVSPQAYGLRPQFFLPHPDQVAAEGEEAAGSKAKSTAAKSKRSGKAHKKAFIPSLPHTSSVPHATLGMLSFAITPARHNPKAPL